MFKRRRTRARRSAQTSIRSLRTLQARAGAPIALVSIDHFDRANSHITIRLFQREGSLMLTTLTYAGATGAFISEKPILGTRPSIGGSVFALMGPLHFGNFAGWWSKAVWFALGAASAYVTFSGLALWVRRREERPGWRALGRLNAWVGAGLPFAMAASAVGYFLALKTDATLYWTPAAFVIAAAFALIPALIVRAARITPILFSATGVVLLTLPVLRIATRGPSWSAALAAGQLAIPVLDILVSIGAVACLCRRAHCCAGRKCLKRHRVRLRSLPNERDVAGLPVCCDQRIVLGVSGRVGFETAGGAPGSFGSLRPLATAVPSCRAACSR